MTIPLRQIDSKNQLPKIIPIPDCECLGVCDCDSSWLEGMNKCVSELDKLVVVIDEKELEQQLKGMME